MTRLSHAAVIMVLCLTPAAHAQGDPELLNKLKAAYVYNIAKFVAWDDQLPTVNLCLQATHPLLAYVTLLEGRDLNGRVLRVITQGGVADDLADHASRNCHMYYGSPSGDLSNKTMIISDSNNALSAGAHVQLVVERGQLRFRVHERLRSPENSGLRFRASSKLLRLARDS